MRTIYLSLTIAFLFKISFAQLPSEPVPSKEYITSLKKCTLAVVLLEENERLVEKLTKKKKQVELDGHRKAVENYNNNIKTLVPQFLNITEHVIYKPMRDIVAMDNTERAKYAFLVYNTSGRLTSFNDNFFNFYNQGKRSDYGEIYQETVLDTEKVDFAKLELYIKDKKSKATVLIMSKGLSHILPTVGDIASSLMQMQKYINDQEQAKKLSKEEYKEKIYKNAAMLKEKTLLINKENLNKKTTDEVIKKNYPYKYKVVSQEEFDKAIIEKNSEYCYLMIVPLAKTPSMIGTTAVNYAHAIIEASTNEIATFAMAHVGTGGVGLGFNDIKEKHFDNYLIYVK